MDQDHYPERLGVIVVVNAPRVISIVWNFIKKYLDPVTREKVGGAMWAVAAARSTR